MCGACCEGAGGIVVSPEDALRLSRFLDLSLEEFHDRYTEPSGTKRRLVSDGRGRCVLFRDGAGCGVHEAKPAVCKAWPFFRGNLMDPVSLSMAKDFCPGIDRDVPHDVFARAGRDVLAREGLAARDPATEANTLIPDRER
jgi:Fe-S-cluster containining protein